MPQVPVSNADKKISYYKYFVRPMADPPAARLNAITSEPGDINNALHIKDRNRLFEPGDLPGQFGWWKFDDGTSMIANQTLFPGTSGKMFDWWFAWHPIDRLRYAIWDPKSHFDIYIEDESHMLSFGLSVRERHWGSVHQVWEDIGLGKVDLLRMAFKRPDDMGYDEHKIDTGACNALICANCQIFGTAYRSDMPVVLTHFMRPAEGGSELRSYYWFGWQIEDRKPVKKIPDGSEVPDEMNICLLKHTLREYTNLAAILPELYSEEKDNWLYGSIFL